MKNEKKTNKKTTRVIIALVIVLLIGLAIFGGVAAYWVGQVNSPTEKDGSVTITVGQGKEVSTEFNLTTEMMASNTVLVPAGKAIHSDTTGVTPVEEYSVQVKVKVVEPTNAVSESDGITFPVSLTATGAFQETDAQPHNSLIVVNVVNPVSTQATVNGTTEVTFDVRVTLTEPGNQTIYNSINSKTIVITFKASTP